MTERNISVQEATVATVTVEVESIQINNKQMTLSVFRQLISEPVIDLETGSYFGEMWGTVNYHSPSDCYAMYGPSEHYHIVWQKGNQLRRDLVYFNRLEQELIQHGLSRANAVGIWERLMGLPQLFIAV